MTDVLNKDIVKGLDPLDMVLGSLVKPAVEKLAAPVVGNGNLLSGGVKILGAFGAVKYAGNNRFGKALAIGAGMDGAEDVILGISSKLGVTATSSVSGGVF